MAHDMLDSILSSNPPSKVGAGLQKVCNFVGKHGLAHCTPDGKCVVGTTAGVAYVGALKGATELVEQSMKGDKRAKGYIARMKQRSDAGDPLARGTMGVLDVAAMALRDVDFPGQYQGDFATQFSPGFESPDWAENRGENDEVEFGATDQNLPSQYVTYGAGAKYAVRFPDGTTKKFKNREAANAWLKTAEGKAFTQAHGGKKRQPQRAGQPGQPQRPGQQRPGQPGQPQRPGVPQQQRSPYATQGQVQSAINRVPAPQRQAFISQIQQQQQQNLQQGYGQPVYPGQAGYPWPQGSMNYGQPYYAPGAQGYGQGMGPGGYGYGQPSGMYGVASSTYGGPGMYATQDYADDGTFQEEPAPGDVQFEDEGADSTETAASDME